MATLLGGKRCVDPRNLASECARAGLPTSAWLGKANQFTLTAGRGPGRGHVLLQLADLDALATTSDLALTFSGTDSDHVVALSPITLLKAECVAPGGTADPTGVFLCEVVDRRHHLMRVPLAGGYVGYNVTNAAGGGYLSATLTGGIPWTWQQVVDDLVTTLGEDPTAFLLPFTPYGTPQNLVFDGCSAWEALNRVLDRLACAPALDLVTDTFSVVRLGVAQDADLDAITTRRTWDGYGSEPARAWRPEKVRVRFLRRPVDTDGATPYYTVDVTLAAATGVVSGTFVQVDDDATAEGATGVPSNAATLATRAAERASDWLRTRLYYARPVLRAWRDFVPTAVGLASVAVNRIVFDDRGVMQTWATANADGHIETFRPLGDYPPWWPLVEAESSTPASSAWKTPAVRAATTTALPACTYANGSSGVGATLTGNANGVLTAQDGVTLSFNQDLLVKDQASALQNGIYTLTAIGTSETPFVLTRRTDADSATELPAATVAVTQGTTNENTIWQCAVNAGAVVGTTALIWLKVGPGGDFFGPSSANDNAAVVFDTTTGKLGQNSITFITDGHVATHPSGTLASLRPFVELETTIGPGIERYAGITLGIANETSFVNPTIGNGTGSGAGVRISAAQTSAYTPSVTPALSIFRVEFIKMDSGNGPTAAGGLYVTVGSSNDFTWEFDGLISASAYSASGVGGVTGALGPGATAQGGIITSAGSGSFGTTSGGSGGATGLTLTGSATLTLGGTLVVANGGTGATDASGARTNLGLVIGVDVQAWDVDLDSVAAGTWTGAASITTLGTIATGTWEADAIASAFGGSGRASATEYAVICGGTSSTGPHQSIATVGTVGQVLTSNGAGELPTFETAAGGSGTVTSINLAVPAEGLTATGGPITTSGDITLGLADDLAALEALTGTDTIYYRSGSSSWTAVTIGTGLAFASGELSAVALAHGDLTELGDDDHAQYALLAGRGSGQTLSGGTGASDGLVLQGTSHGSPSGAQVVIGNDSVFALREIAAPGTPGSGGFYLYPKTDNHLYCKSDAGTERRLTLPTELGTVTTGTWSATAIGETKGGTNQSTYTTGDLLYSSAANTLARLAGNTTATKKFLTQTGTGAISAAPAWAALAAADLPGGAWITDTSDTAAIGSNFTLGASANTYEDVTGLTLTLPAAGDYLVIARLTGYVSQLTGTYPRIFARLVLNGTAVTNSQVAVVVGPGVIAETFDSALIVFPITAAGAHVVKVQAKWRVESGTIAGKFLSADADHECVLSYVRLS